MLKSHLRLAGIAGAVAAGALVAASAADAAPSNLGAVHGASANGIVKVHGDWDDDGDYRGRGYRRHHGERHVDAPFTHVESGRRVVVDAPFAHVYVGRRGRHVVAPFVNLWLPR